MANTSDVAKSAALSCILACVVFCATQIEFLNVLCIQYFCGGTLKKCWTWYLDKCGNCLISAELGGVTVHTTNVSD